MTWPGYFSYAGVEVVNASRVEAYAKHLGVGWFKPVYRQGGLAWLLGEHDYTTPLQDDAPWTDPGNLDSYDFLGVYPLDVNGLEDSTVSAQVTESVIDGGYVGRTRKGTRAIVYNAVLVGRSECAVDYGLRWLRTALNGQPCFNQAYGVCGGYDLCYLSCAPCMCEGGPISADDCYSRVGRSLHEVTSTVGPNVTKKLEMIDGGAAWTVTWTMVAANPAEFGVDQPLVVGFLDPDVDNPYVGGTPPGANFDEAGTVQTDPYCAVVEYKPVFDPTCNLLVAPPDVPTVVPVCFNFPVNYLRRSFTVPSEVIPVWSEVAPVISLSTKAVEARNVRLRFYADIFETGDPASNPCDFCGDVVFSYIPPSSTLVLDGANRQVYVDSPGIGRRRADSLVSDSTGNPFDWPLLSCGLGYVVTVDMPQQQQSPPVIDLTLVPRMS